MRRYELMLVLSPETPDERVQALIDRTTRLIVDSGGQIVKVAPWGRRRLAYEIKRQREGSYHIIVFESTGEIITEIERSLLITEDVLRHLVTRIARPVRPPRRDGAEATGEEGDEREDDEADLPSPEDGEDDEDGEERIDESESEAAPAAVDRE
jgi:small subunit ribosomal protein S6